MFMQFQKLGGDDKPLTFPDHAIIPNTPLVFDDNSLRACVDCRHFRSGGYSGQRCRRYKTFDPIHGWLDGHAPLLRKEDGYCSPKAKGWEAVPSEPPAFPAWAIWLVVGGLLLIGWAFR